MCALLTTACAASRSAGPPSGARIAAGRAPATSGTPALLERAVAEHPVLQDYALRFRARAARHAGRTADALAAAHALLDRHPDSVWAGETTLLIADLQRDDPVAAAAWLDAARRASPQTSSGWVRATLYRAEQAAAGEPSLALDLAREVRRARPKGIAARRARRLMDRVRGTHRELVADPATDRVEEAEMRLREGDAAGARAFADAALSLDPPLPLRGRALWTRAQAERAAGDRPLAEATCLTLARDRDDPLAPRALLAVAGWRWNADDDAQAIHLFADTAQHFAESAQAPEALYAIGRIHQEAGRYDQAFATYHAFARRFPRSTLAPEVRWRAGWVRWLAGDVAAAAGEFGALADRTRPPARVAAEYWEARALERLGRADAARARFAHVVERHPDSYYADAAARRLGRPIIAPDPPATAPRPVFPNDLAGTHAERARVLARLGLRRYARLELDALRASGAPRRPLLEAYQAIGAPGAAMRLAAEVGRRSNGPLVPHLYPLAYWEAVLPAARARQLDPFLVIALIRQESAFEPDAVSSADAHGLMQLLPATARELTGTPPTRAALHDVAVNVDLGTALLARLLSRYSGSTVKALAAYNAGEDAVAKWERRYATREEDEFVELISFRETRDYVKAVLRNWGAYRRLYSDNASATSAGNPPNAPFDMMATTSPARAVETR